MATKFIPWTCDKGDKSKPPTHICDTESKQLHAISGFDFKFPGWSYAWTEGNYSCDCNRGAFCGLPDISCDDGITKRFHLVRETSLHNVVEGLERSE